jgi:hypothetical protein
MKVSPTDRNLVKFSTPSSMDTLIVSRILHDNSTEPIGKIYPDLSNGDDYIIYSSVNNQGEEMMPPTSNFIELEERFKEYANELSMQEFTQAMMEEADRIHDRKTSIKAIRHNKVRDGLSQQIIK